MNQRTGICPDCGFSWSASAEEVLASLRSTRSRFNEALRDSSEDQLRLRPRPDSWSPIEYVGHTWDGVEWYENRIMRTLEEDWPQLTGEKLAVKTENAEYRLKTKSDVLNGVAEASERLATRLGELTPQQWTRQAIGSDGDVRDVLHLARRAAHETEHHCRDTANGVRR